MTALPYDGVEVILAPVVFLAVIRKEVTRTERQESPAA